MNMTRDLNMLYVGILKKGLKARAKEDSGNYLVELLLPNGKVVHRITLVPNSFLRAIRFDEDEEYGGIFNNLRGNDYVPKRNRAPGNGASTTVPPSMPVFYTTAIKGR